MGLYIGVDLGTTTISVLLVDTEEAAVKARAVRPNNSEVTSAPDRERGRSEWDASRTATIATEAIHEVVDSSGSPEAIRGIGLTGQMHGVQLVSAQGRPAAPFIGWQDQRGNEPMPGTATTYAERMRELAGVEGFARTGAMPATGYLGTSLFWLKENRLLPPAADLTACLLADYVAAYLTGERPVTDPTGAGSSGLFDIISRSWDLELIGRLGLPESIFPGIRGSGEQAGELTGAAARECGLRPGIPVFCPVGDNQASFAGSVDDYGSAVLVNIGTGGQVSVHSSGQEGSSRIEARCYPGSGYLLVGSSLCGGRSYRLLRDLFLSAGKAFFGARGDEDIYSAMTGLAAKVPAGADGLRCNPLFAGTRAESGLRGAWSGIGEDNLTPGHMARALLSGMAEELHGYYREMEALGAGSRSVLIGSGNGIRKNQLLREIVAESFGYGMKVPAHEEEAAFGAALLAAHGAGEFPTLAAASGIIRYL